MTTPATPTPEPSPLPWQHEVRIYDRSSRYVYDASGQWLFKDIDEADADLICRAVNAHAALVEALEALLRQTPNIEVLGEWSGLDINPGLQKTTRAKIDEVISKAHVALTLAKGAQL